MESLKDIGRRIYNLKNPREKRRYFVFLLRSMAHRKELRDLVEFFNSDPARKSIFAANPFPVEQATRSFFFHQSTFRERVDLIKNHYLLLQNIIKNDALVKISNGMWTPYVLWENCYEGRPWLAQLVFEVGQRKEGLLSLEINLEKETDGERSNEHIYQIIFWLGRDKNGGQAIWIGALQGPNMENARDVVKKMTKACHGCRTKNLILYMLQAMARAMGIKKIYAVSNYGYYANNHVRADRKLKTNFGDFWLEAGGRETEDKRFYELPLVEKRKTMEEVPTRKRAVYRRRFAFLDEVDAEIDAAVRKILK